MDAIKDTPMNAIVADELFTPDQIRVDEMAAAGDWSEFTVVQLMPEELAFELLEHMVQNLKNHNESLQMQPFLWRGNAYRIVRCEHTDGKTVVEVTPADPEFAEELTRRIEQNRFHTFGYFQAVGFACFPEDYKKYQDA